MIEINVYKDIAKEDPWFRLWDEADPFSFSADEIQRVLDANPNEKEIKFNINCDGGYVSEGLRIYDVLRTSGKTIHTNIEGGCHSMAVVLLLSAPSQNRTANPNARALIHEVRGGSWDVMTSEQLRTLADEIETEQNAILDIYAERTGHDRAELEVLMKEEKTRTAQELLQYGFISKINSYNTNSKNKMSKTKKNVKDFLKTLKNLLEGEAVNYDFTDADGNVLFSTEKEDDSLAVGDAVTLPDGGTDGTFTLPDGRTVIVADCVVSEIQEATNSNYAERIEELENTLTEAGEIIEAQEAELTNLRAEVAELKNKGKRSTFNATPRLGGSGKVKQNNGKETVEDLVNEAKEKRQKVTGGK